MIEAKLGAVYATTTVAQVVAPASAAWAQLDTGIGLKSVVVGCIFVAAVAAALRDKHEDWRALFGAFFGSLAATLACIYFVVRPVMEDPAAQALFGMLLAYNAQLWAGKFTKSFIGTKLDSQDRSDTNE